MAQESSRFELGISKHAKQGSGQGHWNEPRPFRRVWVYISAGLVTETKCGQAQLLPGGRDPRITEAKVNMGWSLYGNLFKPSVERLYSVDILAGSASC